ncbi:glutathione-dependent formaldehyde-activating enzyme [Purpureocillium lavendulum]|uniref:Glutathione-dependent formaldehyde-activating enzyme n=1 Tax=Purpureocillium lavendulum TaxID=1247861 RepID=A0AB34FGA7_9HYPO|nr:glutathione-dependent formaldehyde-activating enzyme [Purpureocillium lavendulum]
MWRRLGTLFGLGEVLHLRPKPRVLDARSSSIEIMATTPIVYRGNCHCGRYRYELTLPREITTGTTCSCSLCVKKGYLWVAPPEGSFRVVRDDGHLVEYGSKALRDKFCGHCGTGVTGEHIAGPLSGEMLVNVRAIQGVNPFKLEPHVTTVETPDERGTINAAGDASHVFACHCGNVQAQLLVPLSELQVKEDNCSSCVRNAYVGVYPTKDQVRTHGKEHGFEYFGLGAEETGRKWGGVVHCSTCGVFVFNIIYGPPLSIFDKLPPERKARALEAYHRNVSLLPLNLRAVEGLHREVQLGSVGVERADEGTEDYAERLGEWEVV